MKLLRNRVIIGDAHAQLRLVPSDTVDMVLTSPPYFRLRDYHVAGQIGLETEVDEWVNALRAVADEVYRVLTPTGSFWLNVADTYSTNFRQGASRKSLLLGPERLALSLIEDGWLIRNKIVWQKANPMPTSVTDRLSCTWEALYVLVKGPSYHFNLDVLRVPHTSAPPKRRDRTTRPRGRDPWRGPNGDDASGLKLMRAEGRVGHPLGKNPGDVWRIASMGYRGRHHATYPEALARRAIRAGCPEARCVVCRKPWRQRMIRRVGNLAVQGALGPSCNCEARSEPGLVLDPFFGSGTTGVAAKALGRDWLGVELNPVFAALAEERIRTAPREAT
jgi:site-specific DNA-methyltransferase (adenine-specific)